MNTEIKEELKEIATLLADAGNHNCYRVPDHYFEELPDEIMSKIQLPFTQSPFTAPASAYFEELAESIMSKIKGNGTIVEEDTEVTRELMEISPLVASIKKINIYTVPAYYFANFKVAIPETEEKVNVVPLRHPVRWMRYAAAAVVIGIVAIGGMLLYRGNTDGGNSPITFTKNYHAPLSTLSNAAIASYLKQSPDELDITPASVDDDKINAGSLAEQLLDDVPDSAIQEYLQDNQTTLDEKDIKGI